MRLWLGVGVAAAAAVAATGAFGVTSAGTITTIAGGGLAFPGTDGRATSVRVSGPRGMAVDAKGNLFFAEGGITADFANSRIRKVSPDGTIRTIAGAGRGYSGDGGPGTAARLSAPEDVVLDAQGNLYITDTINDRVRKLSAGGTITTFAGTGVPGYSGDGGPATSAKVNGPRGIAIDRQGNVYIAEGFRVRKVSVAGTISTIAGTGKPGFSGDGGPATSATFDEPQGVAVDARGNVYIADLRNYRVRKVSPDGTITTFAGTGARGSTGDGGPATSAQLVEPLGLDVDAQGNVYITELRGYRVRRVDARGRITTFAGGGRSRGDGGQATAAQLDLPWGVEVDRKGNVYISEFGGGRVRKVSTRPSSSAALTLTLGGASPQRLLAQKSITVTAKCSRPCSLSASGSVSILSTERVFRLTRTSAGLAAGTRTLTLRFPAAEQARFRQLLKPGQQARAVITVKATDKAGKTSTSQRIVAVR